MARNWTTEEKARQAEMIRRSKPWEKSTGPRTTHGKQAAAQNAHKHGLRGREMQDLRRLLRLQRDFLKKCSPL